MNNAIIENSSSNPNKLMLLPDPEPWPEPVDGSALLDELAAIFNRFVVLPPRAAETLALWTLHTYAFHLRDVSAYLALESPEKRCGKTTLLGVLSRLVYRPVVAANISAPAFFRVIEDLHPTLLIDEADTFIRGNDKLRGILNSGYSRSTAFVVRVCHQRPDSQKPELQTFSCWCPKVIATIGRLPETLADRCIVVSMQRKQIAQKCDRLRLLDGAALRRQLARFVLDHQDAIASARPELPVDMNDRAGDIWEPLLALADLAGGAWPQKAREAAGQLTDLAQETSPIAGLFLGITGVFTIQKTEQIFTRSLVDHLNRLPYQLWRPLTGGKDLTERWLAQLLRPYGISPSILSINNVRARGYQLEEFHEPFRRYVSHSQASALLAEVSASPASDFSEPEPAPSTRTPQPDLLLRQLQQIEKIRQELSAQNIAG